MLRGDPSQFWAICEPGEHPTKMATVCHWNAQNTNKYLKADFTQSHKPSPYLLGHFTAGQFLFIDLRKRYTGRLAKTNKVNNEDQFLVLVAHRL